MLVTLELFAITLLLAGVALYQSRRHSRCDALQASKPVPAVPPAARPPAVRTLVREGHRGDAELGMPVRAVAEIAAADRPDQALTVAGLDGTPLLDVGTEQIVMARAWSRGRLVLAFGEPRREYGPAWALGPGMAGWELHLADAAGGVLRCYGAPHASVDADVDRLRARLQAAAAPTLSRAG